MAICDGLYGKALEDQLRLDRDRALKENERMRCALVWISHIELAVDKDFAIKTAASIAKDALASS